MIDNNPTNQNRKHIGEMPWTEEHLPALREAMKQIAQEEKNKRAGNEESKTDSPNRDAKQ